MTFSAIIEIPRFSINKYELDKNSNTLKLDRVLPIQCPFNYGFIPGIISDDGDPLDIFIISLEPIPPLTSVKIKPWGILVCSDQGLEDNKVIAVIENDFFKDPDYYKKIKFYLNNYKTGFEIKKYEIFEEKDNSFEDFIAKCGKL